MSQAVNVTYSKTAEVVRDRSASIVVFLCLLIAALFSLATLVLFISTEGLYLSTSLVNPPDYILVPYITGLIYLCCAMYVYAIRRSDPAGLTFSIFASAVSIGLTSFIIFPTTGSVSVVWSVSLAVAGGAMINLALIFPQRLRMLDRYPLLGWIGYGIAVLISLLALIDLNRPAWDWALWRVAFDYLGISILIFLAIIFIRWFKAHSPLVREQARLIAWGGFLSFVPLGIWAVLTSINPTLTYTNWFLVPLGLFPLFTAFALLRLRSLTVSTLLNRTVLYIFLSVISVASYALLVGGLALIFGDIYQPANPILIGLMVFFLALGFNPVRNYLQRIIDRYFLRGQAGYQDRLQEFGRELTQEMEVGEIVRLLRRFIEQAIYPSLLHIYVFESLDRQYQPAKAEEGYPTSDVLFSEDSPLVQALSRHRQIIFLKDLGDILSAAQSEKARLVLLGADIFVPFLGKDRLIGWLALGPCANNETYTSRDLKFLEDLCDQTGLALERAQIVADLERRVHEMNILARVAQGVNFTVDFDDILELISAQTNQVLPAADFRVTLYDARTGILQHAFYLENDERLSEMERIPLTPGRGLEEAIVSSQQPILTDDYERECRRRGLLTANQDIFAWMGVPLNTGAQTIGVISVGSRDPLDVYTEEQRSLLQAVADQAAGAIVKSQLLDESLHRARQLASLNEIAVGLTSTLEVKPLLNQIAESATEILDCEAGSLFLVDPETDELVFEVVLGPVAQDLIGQRLPPGTGLVGEAIEKGLPIVANDAKRRKEWHEKMDEQTGFDTQDLMVVPMRIQDRVIGAIEVFNKSNGTPFTQDDQELLIAFTSQATIAIENARLYTMTDQELAARVEELSVMQRIDRELNASLDIERALRITLDWALRQSRADAGLVGIIGLDGAVHVMTSQGFGDELDSFLPSEDGEILYLAGERHGLQKAIESGQPQISIATGATDGEGFGLLKGAQSQIVIPIRRETGTIGVLLIESRRADASPSETVEFLTRLSDHAAIAIANAQLYEEVLQANLAKSTFVSFVAHELKNPMASIKGYSELISGGMAGPVTDMQSNFLATVRTNVDRMNTIVSDLSDLTKIEIGNLRLEYRMVQIGEALDEVLTSLKRQIDEKKQQLSLDLPDDLPLVWADPARVAQILTNLVSNASKYTPDGGKLAIAAQCYSSDEELLSSLEYVHVWIRDEGIGISEEDQKKIFQQYFRTEGAKEMATGTGLGLAITKSLAELQGGRIWFESNLNAGSTFHVTFPVAEDV